MPRYSASFKAAVLEDMKPRVRRAFPGLGLILAAILPKLLEFFLEAFLRRQAMALPGDVEPD